MMSVMRVALAGTGGLACMIANFIKDDTSHQVVFLSRKVQSRLTDDGFQVSVVDYCDRGSLQYALRGIDTVISTVVGPSQIELIHAAAHARVRRFAAAEFEGPPGSRVQNDPLDRCRMTARRWLEAYEGQMQFTSFVCGILYERFQPGGLRQSFIGGTSGFDEEGGYMVDCNTMTAEVPLFDAAGQPSVTVCMTAASDVAQFVMLALQIPQWRPVMTICGTRTTVWDLVRTIETLKGQEFQKKTIHSPASLRTEIDAAVTQHDFRRGIQLQSLLATAEGRYDFAQPTDFDNYFPMITLTTFRDWFIAKWCQR